MKRNVNRKHRKLTMIALGGALSVSLISSPVVALAQENNEASQTEIIITEDVKSNRVECFIKDNDGVTTVDIVVNDETVDTVSQEEIETLLDSDYEVVQLGMHEVDLLLLEKAYYIELGKHNVDEWINENAAAMEIAENISSLKITVAGSEVQGLKNKEFINFLNSFSSDEKVCVSIENTSMRPKTIELTIDDLRRAFYVSQGMEEKRGITFSIVMFSAVGVLAILFGIGFVAGEEDMCRGFEPC